MADFHLSINLNCMEQKEIMITLNDMLRENNLGGRICESPRISQLSETVRKEIREAVRIYDCNSSRYSNEIPNDYGCFFVNRNFIFWQIEYFARDKRRQIFSDDPCDPDITERILCIFMAAEL